MKLLIVEDDQFLREFLKDLLKNEFDEIKEVERFRELFSITVADVDVAIVDLGLPPSINTYEEGIKVVEYIKNSSGAKIIVLTGQESDNAIVESIGKGVFDYIKKPADVDVIVKAVKKAKFVKKYEKKAEKRGKFTINISVDENEDFKNIREQAEKKYLEKLLDRYHFNISKLAKELKITREKIYYYIKKFQLK